MTASLSALMTTVPTVPVVLIAWHGVGGWSALLAGLLAVAGAYYWDRVWVKAGQAIPLS